jgi:hypothetical protein
MCYARVLISACNLNYIITDKRLASVYFMVSVDSTDFKFYCTWNNYDVAVIHLNNSWYWQCTMRIVG